MMELGSLIGFGQLGIYFTLMYFYVRQYGTHLNKTDKWTAIWFGFDGLCHILFEGVYVLFTWTGPIRMQDALITSPWKEYAKSDIRWANYDPTVFSLELVTVLVAGPMALALFWAIMTNNKWRHPLQIIICVIELYGGWMTFAPEWVNGSPNLVVDNFTYLWLYITIPNGLWVVVPFWLLWDSLQHYFDLLEGKRRNSGSKSPKALKTVVAKGEAIATVTEAPPAALVEAPKSPKVKKVASHASPAPKSPTGRSKKN